ncbi:uncharacterized protein [Mobula birostris]|uniref:uncharacterized protein n=1 Tax=Mobula birostris TaxID=1983395 RepID=UPI003B27F371
MQLVETSGKGNPFLFIFLFVVNVAVTLREHPKRVNGTVGQSVLFSASHIVSNFQAYMRIRLSRKGMTIVNYRCPEKRNDTFAGCEQTPSISDNYETRIVLFPENASLLLRDLQISDSGIYELSISHSKGSENCSFTLRVLPQSGTDIDGRSQTGNGTNTGNTKGPHSTLVFILPAVGIAVIIISLHLTIKMRRGCKQAQGQTGKINTPQYHQKTQEEAATQYAELEWPKHTKGKRNIRIPKEMKTYEEAGTQYAELGWPKHTKGKRNIHIPKEMVEYATVQNTSGIVFSLDDRHQPSLNN